MQNFQDIEHFVKTLSAAIKKKIPTKVSQLTNDAGYKTTDTTYKLSKTGSTVTLTGSDGSATSVTDSNTTYSSLKNPYSLDIQNNGTTVASYDGSTAKTVNFTNATSSADGLMSKTDKAKLDGIEAGSNVKSVNGKTGAVTLSKADVGLGNVDNTSDVDKPYYKLIGQTATNNKVGHFNFNDASRSLYKIKNFYAASGEGDYFYLLHKKSDYTITATKHFSNTDDLFTADLSSDCTVATDLISESDPARLKIVRKDYIESADNLTLIFYEDMGCQSNARLKHWKLEILTYTAWKKSWEWITVFERTNVSDSINCLWCGLNPNDWTNIGIKGICITIYAATPYSTESGDSGYNQLKIAGMRLLDSRPSFSPAEALGALDVAGGTVYGETTFQEGISATSYSGATATSSADGLMSKDDKAKLDTLKEKLYPVGSIYLSVNDTNPGTFIGGTWEQIKDRFLLAAGDTYAAGSTGGEATHTLTVDEMPKHRHSSDTYQNGYPSSFTEKDNYCTWVNRGAQSNNGPNYGESGPVRTSWVGGSKPHNNMPPYLAVYMWKRVS